MRINIAVSPFTEGYRKLPSPLIAFVRRNGFEVAAYLSLAVIYCCDVITPADLSIEVGYEVPVAIMALPGRRASIVRMAIIAAVVNVLGYVTEIPFLPPAVDPIGFQNRIIAFVSLVLVSALVIILQASSEKAGRLQEQQRTVLVEQQMAREIGRRDERLVERQEVIGELVEAIAHDVRTPLEALSLTLNQALRGQYGELPDSYREVVRESRISIGAITQLADSLLAVARFESQSATPKYAAVDAAALARDMIGEFTQLAEAREIALTHDVPEVAYVMANLSDLRRAMANLLSNAIRHTSAGGRISIDATECAGGWKIDVVDDGIGISPAQAVTLFSRYKRGADGTGLGLHIVKRIVDSFGGTVSYTPVVPHGSRFSIRLLSPSAVA